jgi:hypothetical protein
MPRDGSLTPRDLVEKLDMLRVECEKCGRSGRYRVLKLAEQIGWDGKLTDWLYNITADCPRQALHSLAGIAVRSVRSVKRRGFSCLAALNHLRQIRAPRPARVGQAGAFLARAVAAHRRTASPSA